MTFSANFCECLCESARNMSVDSCQIQNKHTVYSQFLQAVNLQYIRLFKHIDHRVKMSRRNTDTDAEMVLTGLEQLNIDDSRVNKMTRRRSVRIQAREERRKTIDINYDWFNNNLPTIDSPMKETSKSTNEIELEFNNVHYQTAIKLFQYIQNNEFIARRKKCSNDDDIGTVCDCILTTEQILRSEKGCGNKCLNHVMSIQCNPSNCHLEALKLGQFCGNQQFQRFQNAKCAVFITELKGYGLFASKSIPKDTFIMEFVGEVVTMTEFKKRSKIYAKNKMRHCYVMTSSGNYLIDATQKGNLTRFVNHSCDPNAETQKWTVNGENRIGIFSKRTIQQFEEITINYQFERFG